MAKFPGFIGGSYLSSSVNADCQRAINLFPEVLESGSGANVGMLRGTPGLVTKLTLATTPVRGVWAGGAPLSGAARLFAVGGSKLYEISSVWVATLLGDVGDDATHTPVQMFPNGTQLGIVSAGKFYLADGVTVAQPNFISASGFLSTAGTAVTWSEGTLFDVTMVGESIRIGGVGGTVYTISAFIDPQHITLTATAGTNLDVEFTIFAGTGVTATTGAFLDGYAIAATPNSKEYQLSGINEFGEWDPLDSAIKQSYPDNIGSVLADHEELYLFGESSIEVWRDTGGSATNTFPFARDPGACMSIGTGAPWSCVSTREGVAWIKADTRGGPAAYFAKGYQPVRVSTHAIEAAWAAYSTVVDAQAFVYEMDGHEFWQINFPTANTTWVYDLTASQQMGKPMWHEKTSYNGATFDRHRARCHAFVFGTHVVGDFANGNVYSMSTAAFDDAGTAITCIRTFPHMNEERLMQFFSRLTVNLETPTGGPSSTLTLDWSDDGGHTFYTPALALTTSFDFLAYFNRLGKSRDRVFRLMWVGAVKKALIDVSVEHTVGVA